MLLIDRLSASYYSHDIAQPVKHYILIAHFKNQKMLLSYPNLFLYSHTQSSLQTSNRYSNIISMFYRFLSGLPEFQDIDPGYYHALATNRLIKRWQSHRATQPTPPKHKTIYEDAKVLMQFFRWIITVGYTTAVTVNTKTWIANFKDRRMLNYLVKNKQQAIDSSNIKILTKQRQQKNTNYLITSKEVRAYLSSFDDPVYAAMFKLALGTAMRPMELCKFPYIGTGPNNHVIPFSDMNATSKTVDYMIVGGKGNKDRKIVINCDDLRVLEQEYIIPHFQERAKKYREKYGKKCPPSILFLNSAGDPVTPSKVANRGSAAKRKAKEIEPTFRDEITFYSTRKWWPTMYLVKFYKDELLTEKSSALYPAVAQVLQNQMGHEDLQTTYDHYIDAARLLVMSHQGLMNDLVKGPDETVSEFISRVDKPS